MQAKDLIVLGSSRLLGKLYCGDIDIGGSASISTISSALSLTNTTDSSSTTTGALKVSGGVGIAKKLYVGGNTYHSGSTYFGSTYNISSSGQATLSQVKVGTGSGDTTITNNSATIANITSTEIKATNVNVTNKLYALKYDLESVADLGGSFIVAPTLIVPNSTQATNSNASLTVAKSGTTLTLTIKDPSISTNQIAGFTWTQNYKVKVSGKISNTAIGTCTGKITSTNLSSTQMTLSVTCDSNIASQITAGSYQIANYNLNIMLYNADTSASGETLPIGIWLQSYGLTKNPTIEIWNGASTIPKVRLGYLNGIVYDKKDNTTNPNGLNQTLGSIWGLYSSDVYLEGSIVAKGGRIGGWTIGDGYITSNSNRTTYNATTAGITIDKDGIGAGNGSLNTFYLKHSDGSMMVKKGIIANFTIDGSKLYSNSHSAYNTAKTGIYIGDDYISFGNGGVTYFDVNGTGQIGPWKLSTTYFRNGNIANATNTSVSGVYLGTDGLNISNGTAATTSYITKSAVNIGNKLTWNGSVLKVDGEITASKLTISSGATIGGDGASQILNSELTDDIADAKKTATNCITEISNAGIWVTPFGKKPTNTSTGAGATGTKIDANGVGIYNSGTKLAEYGSITKFYDGNGIADTNIAAQIGADGLDVIKGHIGDWTIEGGDIKYSAGVNETSPTISLIKQSTSNLRSIASIDASSSSETNPNSGARISVFYQSYNSSTQTWQGDFAGCYILPDKISLLSIQGRSLIEPNTISVGGSSPTSTIESVSTGGGAFIQANSAASEANVKAMSGGGTVYLFSSNNGNRGMYGTNSSNTGHSIIDVTNTNASYFRGQATSVSDLKKKNVIIDYNWKIDEFINGLKPIAFRRIHEDGTLGDRIRMGFGAQDVRDLTRSLYDEELSLYQAKIVDETKDGTERESSDYHGEDIDDEKLSWSLAYEELIAPMVLEIQRLMDRVDKLEKELQNK